MKKLMTIVLVMALGMGWTMAQDKKNANVKTTTFVTDIHCENCSAKVMNNVPALGKGIKDVAVNVAQKTVTVTYDANKNSDEMIIKGLHSLSIKAQAAKPECGAAKADCCKDKAAKPECGAAKADCCKDKAAKPECGAAKADCCKDKAAKPECGVAKTDCCKDKE